MRGRSKRIERLRANVLRALAESEEKVLSTSQVFYLLVSAGALANAKNVRRNFARLLVMMRREGLVPYSRIVDRTRGMHLRASWGGVVDIMEAAAIQYRRNLWIDQPTIPIIVCEKQALEGVMESAADVYGARVFIIRGYDSEANVSLLADEIQDLRNEGRDVAIYYFGDWDPSGLNIEASHRERLRRDFGIVCQWKRAALLAEDFDRFGLIPVPVKRGDPRAKRFLIQFADGRAAELDSLKPAELRRRVAECIERHITDRKSWEALERVEAAERASLDLVVKNWDAAVAGAKAAG